MMATVGITAMVPPELVYGCGQVPVDLNNIAPTSTAVPRSKLCAWTATWRDALLSGKLKVDRLAVVAGGDCHNALADGQRVAMSGIPTHYFFYPFDGDVAYMEDQLERFEQFLGGIVDQDAIARVAAMKSLAVELDAARARGEVPGAVAFNHMIALCDLGGDPGRFERSIRRSLEERSDLSSRPRVALVGVPPIYPDFHEVAEGFGLQVVFDELPWEFARCGGRSIGTMAASYADYTFARPLEHRLDLLGRELEKRKVDGIIHYTQYACHHMLEDDTLRARFDLPMLTVQGDLPRRCPEQEKLRLEAFAELLTGGGGR
jgi:benzoyl-CoA reductase/2-hydroxyglutaryl-CoA dehydratase subunit BcrC/BadD/HgdB